MSRYADVDAYLAGFDEPARQVLAGVRRAVREAAPDAEEAIAYDMPTYRLGGRTLVHFAGWRHYVSVYPLPSVEVAARHGLEPALSAFRATRSTGRFPLGRPVPLDLLTGLVRALREERFGEASGEASSEG